MFLRRWPNCGSSSELKREVGSGLAERTKVGRPWQDSGPGTLWWAVLLSVAAHAIVFFPAALPQANRAAGRLAATLVVADRADGQTPLQSAIPEMNKSVNKPRRNSVADNAQRYYPSAELDKRSFPLAKLDFPYPGVSGAGLQGTLELTLYVGKNGVVDRVQVDFASVDQKLVDLAIESLRATPFSPGERDRRAVGARLRLAVDYAQGAP